MTEPTEDKQRGASAPPPPPPPSVAPGTPSTVQRSQQVEDSRARAVAKRKGKGRKAVRLRLSKSTWVAIVAAVVVVVGAFFALQALGVAQSKPIDTRLSDTPSQNASGASGSSSESSADEEAAQKQAKADVQKALDALADDENGQFRSYVEEFVAAYDEGNVEGSYSLADIGVTADDLSVRLRSEFECTVAKVDVYNGMAWVDVDVTSKNLSGAVESFAKAVAGDALKCDDEQEYIDNLKSALLESIDRQKARTFRVLLTLERDGNSWSLERSDIETLLGAAWYS